MIRPDPRIDAIAASDLSSAAILAALMLVLQSKGLLSFEEIREIYEQALLLLEQNQAGSPEIDHVFKGARAIIEAQLLPDE